MKALLIPIKDPLRAKTRLADLLTGEERRHLVWTMFEDVSLAAAAATKPDRIVVVTSFAPAAECARILGWDVLIEEQQTSESASVDWASRVLGESGFDTVMRLPADVPLVKAEDIDELMAIELIRPAALLVPSCDGTGTNAIIRTPPGLFPSRFGPNSLALHKEEAARVGVECVIVTNPGIALDIDDPSDLELFMKCGQGTRTFNALVEMEITYRIGRQPMDSRMKADS